MKNSCKLYAFIKASRGNWRNTIYIPCECTNCPYGHTPTCTGFLMVANEDGNPLLISESDFISSTGETLDPRECCGTMSRYAFENLYTLFFQWHMESICDCPLWILSRSTAGACQNQSFYQHIQEVNL